MTDLFKPFPKIGQYRNALKTIKYLCTELGHKELTFTGTVKLHGTNAAIQYSLEKDDVLYQSRNSLITVNNDNYGFANWAEAKKNYWKEYLLLLGQGENAILYGEWCGSGIQKNVAISQLPKMFVIFKCLVDGKDFPLEELPTIHIPEVYNTSQFDTYTTKINLTNFQEVSNELGELTSLVEEKCPVAYALGKIEGIGEGIVWTCDQFPDNSDLLFKVKGEKHSVSKVKTLAPINPEKLANVKQFIEYAVTENRLQQGIEQIGLSIENTGKFIGWVNKDIYQEESDVLETSGLTMKDVGKQLSTVVRQYYISRLNS